MKYLFLIMIGGCGFVLVYAPEAFYPATLAGIVAVIVVRSLPYGVASVLATLPFPGALNVMPAGDILIVRILAPLLWIRAAVGLAWRNTSIAPVTLSVFLFLAAVGVSMFFADIPAAGLRKFIYLLSVLPLLCIGESAGRVVRKYLLTTLCIPSIIVSTGALFQFLAQYRVPIPTLLIFWHETIIPLVGGEGLARIVREYSSLVRGGDSAPLFRGTSLFPDPHTFSLYLGVGMSIAFAATCLCSQPRRVRLGAMGVLVVLGVGLATSLTRSAYVSALVSFGSMIAILICGISHKKDSRVRPRAQGSLLIVCMVLSVFFLPLLYSVVTGNDASVRERVDLIRDTIRISLSHPWTGVGLGNLPFVLRPENQERLPVSAHNLYLEVFAETGIIGSALFVFLLLLIARRLMRAASARREPVPLAAWGSFVWFVTQSFFEPTLYAVIPTATYLLLWGSSMSPDR
ncbi:MAG: O-antigen ligase family protein [Parcubacteria group bacterium]|nr:O-antigen ligase family protein [Parcubacteria group bacterium]